MPNLFKALAVSGREIYIVEDTIEEAIHFINEVIVSIKQITGEDDDHVLIVAGE